jgi:hypothetical protein
MMADSKLWRIVSDDDENGALRLELVQTFRDAGAHGVEYFEIETGEVTMRFLSIPNYYGKTNVVYRYDAATGKFAEFQTLALEGPAQCEAFTLVSTTYLLVGENFKHQIVMFKFSPSENKFVEVQKVQTAGAGAMAVVSDDSGGGAFTDFPYIVSTSYHSNGWETRTPIFKWNTAERR